jgi:hypothetical protein
LDLLYVGILYLGFLRHFSYFFIWVFDVLVVHELVYQIIIFVTSSCRGLMRNGLCRALLGLGLLLFS